MHKNSRSPLLTIGKSGINEIFRAGKLQIYCSTLGKCVNYLEEVKKVFGIKKNDPDLAYALISSLGLSSKDHISRKAQKIISICKTQKDVLLKAIELCGNGDTPQQRYVKAYAYSHLGASYRPQAINSIELYLSGPYFEKNMVGHHVIFGQTMSQENEIKIHKEIMFEWLASAYEGEYEFEQAYKYFTEAYDLVPFYSTALVGAARVLIKMNKLDNAIALLEKAKQNQYYQPRQYKLAFNNKEYFDDAFKKIVDSELADAIEKKSKGYVYRPRKKKLQL